MSEIIELSAWLKAQPEFETKKRMLVFTDLIHTPTGEKVKEGFRYFHTDIDAVLAAFDAGDLEAISKLPYAIDDDGDVDTSSVCLLIAHTPSGTVVAAQPEEYQDYVPVRLREPKYFPGAGALAKSLDQSS